ncbi:MAG: PEGA domain-containing protein [Oscillatoriales cyanobacterium SM2_2_1]|nr:PEGA domain-containing protein [Oscillatoriales cyanobacterium SM2_2_1]
MTKNIPSSVQEGHAHVYLNGQKLGRTHTITYRLKSIPQGTHQVRVVLSTNGYEEITVQGQPVSGTVTITR